MKVKDLLNVIEGLQKVVIYTKEYNKIVEANAEDIEINDDLEVESVMSLSTRKIVIQCK